MKKIIAFLLAFSSFATMSQAATYYWDDGTVTVNGASGGGAGTWVVGGAGWEDAATAQNWANGNDAVFGGTAGAIAIDAAGVSANTLTVSAAGYSFTGGTLTLAAGGSSSGNVTFGNAWTLGAAQTWTSSGGESTFNGGVNNGGNLWTLAGTGNIRINASGASGVISGAGGITKSGTGVLYAQGTHTYSGITTISAGYMEVSQGALSLANSVLNLTSTDTRGVDIWAGKLTVRGLTGTGSIAANGAYNNGASWWWTTSTDKVAISINTPAGESYSFSGILKNSTWSGGVMTLEKTGPGTQTLTGANSTFTGAVIVNGGTLVATGASANTNTSLGLASGSRTITVNNGGTLKFTSNNVFGGGAQTLANTPKVVVNSGGTMTITTYNVVGNIDLNGGTLTATGGSNAAYQTYEFNGSTITVGGSVASTISSTAASNGGMHIAGGKTLTLNVGDVVAGADLTVSAALLNGSNDRVGAGALLKTGAGTVVLSGSNSYTGNTTINGGTIQLSGGANRLPATGAVTLGNVAGATLDVNGQNQTVSALSGGGALGGNIALGSGSGALTVNQTTTTSYDGAISGTGSVTKSGAGSLTLGGTSTYSGAMTVNAGTLNVTGSLAAGSAVTVSGTATLSGSGTVGGSVGVTGTLTGTLTAGTVTVNNGGTLAPGTAGVGTLTTGNLNLGTGAGNTATINMSVAANAPSNSIQVNGAVAPNGGAGTVTFAFGTALQNINTGTYALISYTGTQLADIGAFTYTGTKGGREAVSLVNGTQTIDLQVSSDWPLWSGAASSDWSAATGNWKLNSDWTDTNFQANDTVHFDDTSVSQDVNLTANVNPLTVTVEADTLAYTLGSTGGFAITTGTLIKTGAGTLTINNANTFAGGTVISGGTITLGHASALGTGSVALNGGALDLNGLTVGNAMVLGGGGFSGDGTLTGSISGTGVLSKNTGSTLTLSGNNTHTGGTALSAGTLNINSATALGAGVFTITGGTLDNTSGGSITLNNNNPQAWNGDFTFTGSNALNLGTGAVTLGGNRQVTVSANTLTVGGVISGGYTLTKSGSGTMTLTGNNTYTGGTTVNGGTLAVSGTQSSTGVITVGNGTLTVAGNWDNQGNVTINSGGTLTITSGGIYRKSDGSARYANGLSVTINTGGTLNLNSFAYNGEGGLGGSPDYGTLRVLAGGTINVTGNTHTSGQDFYVANGSSGTFNMVTADQTLTLMGNGNTNIAIGGALTFGGAGNITVSEVIQNNTGAGSIIKSGGGTLTLSGANTYSGGSTVTGGMLVAGSTQAFGTGTVVVNGGGLDMAAWNTGVAVDFYSGFVRNTYNNSVVTTVKTGATMDLDVSTGLGSLIVETGGVLKGEGTVLGDTTISGTQSPGKSPGSQTFNTNLTYNDTALLEWEFNGNSLGVRGVDFDALDVNGNLTISAGAKLKIINLQPIDYSDAAWNVSRDFTVIAVAGGSASTGLFTLDPTGDTTIAGRGAWSVVNNMDGVSVDLHWTAIPEPATFTLIGTALLIATIRRRKVE